MRHRRFAIAVLALSILLAAATTGFSQSNGSAKAGDNFIIIGGGSPEVAISVTKKLRKVGIPAQFGGSLEFSVEVRRKDAKRAVRIIKADKTIKNFSFGTD